MCLGFCLAFVLALPLLLETVARMGVDVGGAGFDAALRSGLASVVHAGYLAALALQLLILGRVRSPALLWLTLQTLALWALAFWALECMPPSGGTPGCAEDAGVPMGVSGIAGLFLVLSALDLRQERLSSRSAGGTSIGAGLSASEAFLAGASLAVGSLGAAWLDGPPGFAGFFSLLAVAMGVWAALGAFRTPFNGREVATGWAFHAALLCLGLSPALSLDSLLSVVLFWGSLFLTSLFWLSHVCLRRAHWLLPSGVDEIGAPRVGVSVSGLHSAPLEATDLPPSSETRNDFDCTQREFLATMSHELRTPLSCIVGLTRLWAQDAAMPEEAKHDMGTVERMAVQLLRIVDDGLTFVQSKHDTTEPDSDVVHMRLLLRDLHSIGAWLAAQQQNQFTLGRLRNIPSRLVFDERRTRQVLINLLSNAARFCNKGVISLGIELRRSRSQFYLNWVVRDSGRGMDAQEQAKYFTAFTKSRDSTGLGLGLTLARKMVHEMGGQIEMRSTKGAGTAVALLIPVRLASPQNPESRFSSDSGRDVLSPPSVPMDLQPKMEFSNLDFVSLRGFIKLGQISEIGDWIQNAQSLGLSPTASDLVGQLQRAYLRVDLSGMQAILDRVDTPLSFVQTQPL